MRGTLTIRLAAVGAMILVATVARAQQQGTDQNTQSTQPTGQPTQPAQPSQPIPAYHSPLASVANNGDETYDDTQKLVPDTTALTGIQDLSLGMPATTHSYWQPHLDFSSTVDSNPLAAQGQGQGQSGWTTFTSVFGGIDLHRNSGNSALTLSYIGGGSFSNDGNVSNGVIQGLNFSERLAYRRYVLSFFDQFMYAPQTPLGAAGIPNGPTLPGGGNVGLGGGYTPGQTILTARGQRVTNFTGGEMDVLLTSRSSLTFVGGYNLLDSLDNSQLNYGNEIFTAGYNYQMSRANTIGFSYQFSGFNYSNVDQSIKNNIMSVSFGRRITGKLAFQASGGPDIAFVRMPITTAPGSTGSTPGSSGTQVYGSFGALLQYRLQRTGLTAAYNHGVSGGSGVLAGSVADNVTGTVNRQVSRTFNVGWNAGYSRNRGLAIQGTTTSNQTYDYWFTGVNVSHPLGRALNVFLNYQLQYQNTNTSICTGTAACGTGTSLTRNQITFGVGWHKQPIPF
jgi:hypothetical protein